VRQHTKCNTQRQKEKGERKKVYQKSKEKKQINKERKIKIIIKNNKERKSIPTATVSTLVTVVGHPNTPQLAGNGGFMRGLPGFPSKLSINDVYPVRISD
jgi:hypothetical protein